jgi:protein ImuB
MLAPWQDHRPERASIWRVADAQMARARRNNAVNAASVTTTATAAHAAAPLAARPVWLLPHPEPLRERDSTPLLDHQPLQLLSGPERIETGWWDAALAERDYFIAQQPGGALVWIYRSRLPVAGAGWFLQGRFG